jgi:hypothetical protein
MSEATDKLARTRLAIIAHIQQRQHRSGSGATQHAGPAKDVEEPLNAQPESQELPHGAVHDWVGALRRAASTWWRHHPAHAGVELVQPVIATYVRRAPLTCLAVSAAAGAALFLARPWRLISVTGLLLGLFKSSQLSAIVLSALSAVDYGRNSEPPT